MSCTLVNLAIKSHEEAKRSAMEAYPVGHPARYAIWQEFCTPVPGADEFHISEWAIMPIWNGLIANGWPKETTMFPCKDMKRLALLAALTRLLDQAVDPINPLILSICIDDNCDSSFIAYNTQKVEDALEDMIAFLERNEEVYTL